jgi:hypothetical protein
MYLNFVDVTYICPLNWSFKIVNPLGGSIHGLRSSIQQHIAMHIRRGDVGEASGYALTQQLDPSQLSRWDPVCHCLSKHDWFQFLPTMIPPLF